MLVFDESGKPDYPERKTSQSKGANQQEVYSTHGVRDLNVGHNLVGENDLLLLPLITLAPLGLGHKATKGSVEFNMSVF